MNTEPATALIQALDQAREAAIRLAGQRNDHQDQLRRAHNEIAACHHQNQHLMDRIEALTHPEPPRSQQSALDPKPRAIGATTP